jgi:hypothetical protein
MAWSSYRGDFDRDWDTTSWLSDAAHSGLNSVELDIGKCCYDPLLTPVKFVLEIYH